MYYYHPSIYPSALAWLGWMDGWMDGTSSSGLLAPPPLRTSFMLQAGRQAGSLPDMRPDVFGAGGATARQTQTQTDRQPDRTDGRTDGLLPVGLCAGLVDCAGLGLA